MSYSRIFVAKIIDSKGKESFVQVVKIGKVLFDPRPHWLLVEKIIGGRKRDPSWINAADVSVIWIRDYTELKSLI